MATFKVGEVEEQARLILLDTEESAYRFEPKEIYQAIAQGVERIRRTKPVSRYVDMLLGANVEFEHTIQSQPNPSTFRDKDIRMERRWLEAVVYYVVHKMYLKDDPDTTNANLAAQYLKLFNEAIA